MNYRILFTTFLLLSNIVSGQRRMSTVAVNEDFKIFKNILNKAHPALYAYADKDRLDEMFFNTEKFIKDSVSSDIALYKKMIEISDQIKDGHLKIYAPRTMKTAQYYFPLVLKLIQQNFYTDTDDFGIPVGSKIIAINDKKSHSILKRLLKYAPSDGHILTKKYRDIESKFGLFYSYEFGNQKVFHITYEYNRKIKDTSIDSESFAKVKLRSTKRKSYFANYHKREDGITFFDQYIGKKEPFVHYKSNLETAILVVNSFQIDPKIFQTKLSKLFAQITHKKVKNLVIDIRYNTGGYRENAIYLYSFLAKKPFKQNNSEFVSAIHIPEKQHTIGITREDEEHLKIKFYQHPQIDGWKVTYDEMEIIMAQHPKRFIGKTYVLTGGRTFSTASTFAINAKNDPQIKLIGEKTGGGYYFDCSEFPITYQLPNSGIVIHMSMERVNHHVLDQTIPRGQGVPVDRYIPIKKEHMITGKDPQLDYVLKLISGQ